MNDPQFFTEAEQQATEPTSLCDTCREPGYCCRGFVLSGKVPISMSMDEYAAGLHEKHPYFQPIRRTLDNYTDDGGCADGMTSWSHSCTRLDEHGRCSDYENRPGVCRDYEPASNNLCAEGPVYQNPPAVIEPTPWADQVREWVDDLSRDGWTLLAGLVVKEIGMGRFELTDEERATLHRNLEPREEPA